MTEREEMIAALQHALAVIVEFGDLNGFRNLSDNELGSLICSTATEIGNLLNRVAPLTEEQKRAVELHRATRGAGRVR